MTLPVVPGSSLSLSQVNTELGYSSTAQISLNDSAVRTLAGVGASPATISFSNLSGKSNTFSFTVSSNQTNANLRSLALSAGWNGTTKVVATINSGVYISSNSTGTPALTINGSFPNGVQLINNGIVVGMGGNGGKGGGYSNGPSGANGSAGGLALSVSVATTINNNNIIAGGGGGGGGACSYSYLACGVGYVDPGGGGGGGRSSLAANSSGGAPGQTFSAYASPGAAGTVSGAGAGGAGYTGNPGGNGGDWGSSGANGYLPPAQSPNVAGSGGAGGGAVSGNSNITWAATGTRYGSIS